MRSVRVACAVAAAAVLLAGSAPAHAQSAADKATARELATDGIKLFRANKYADALDKLQRAESMYDAPVHLLYIARCQVQLGKLVEGAETYRKLARVELQAGAPSAFKEAQDAGGPELSQLEPRIPSIKLEISPDNVQNLQITMDGESMPAAAVGVDRPANPGSHSFKVTAPGYESAEASVQIKEHEKKPVKITLRAAEGGAVAVVPPPGGTTAPPPGSSQPPSKEPPPNVANIGFMLGLRLGASIPGGTLQNTGNNTAMSDFAGSGGGIELHGGVRFAKYFTPVLIFVGHAFKPGPVFDSKTATPGVDLNTTIDSTSGGIGLIVGTPRNKYGFFGELDFFPIESYSAHINASGSAGINCTATETVSGTALRIGGGGVLPVASFLHLNPFIMYSTGKFTKDKGEGTGVCAAFVPNGEQSIADSDQAAHNLVFVGLGGDFVFGNDKPPE